MIKNDLMWGLDVYLLNDIWNFVHDNIPEDKHDEFHKLFRLLHLYLYQIEENKEEFDWKYLIENGKFCENDFKYFGKNIEKMTGIKNFTEAKEIYKNIKEKK